MRTRIRLFGTFRLARGNDQPVRLATRRAQELLSFLVLNRHRRHSREALATLLWDGSSPAQSRKYLRHTLWQVQAALDCHPRQRNAALLAEPEWIGFNRHDQVWIDVLAFEEACAKVHTAAGGCLSDSDADALKGAVELYHGDLLQDWYCEWCRPERERLQHLLIAAFDRLIEHAELQHRYDAGIEYGQRVLKCDRARERTHCVLMRLYYLAGDRTAALRQYERCVSALHDELDVAPARTTVALYDEIRADRLAGAPSAVGVPAIAPSAAPERDALSRLQTLLTDTQAKIEEGLTAVGEALTAQGAGRTGPGR
jgi:DNA-binding SARP family transcriptional activator